MFDPPNPLKKGALKVYVFRFALDGYREDRSD
jgi:hypothetical protein